MGGSDWVENTFEVGCLGLATATGTVSDGFLRSVQGACALDGNPVEFTVWWKADAEAGWIEPTAVSAGLAGAERLGGRLTDDQVDEIKDLVGSALAEWWETPEAREMAAENARRAASAGDARKDAAAKDVEAHRTELRALLAAGPPSIAEMERAIRELWQAERLAQELAAG